MGACGCERGEASGRLGETRSILPPGGVYAEIARRGKLLGKIRTPTEGAWLLEPLAYHEPQEVAVVVALGVHSEYLSTAEIARGGVEHVELLIPLGIRAVVVAGALGGPGRGQGPAWPQSPSASLWGVLAHNHPSGSATPSTPDVRLWHGAQRQFAQAGLVLLDHLILGRGEFYSCAWESRWRLTG